MPFRKKTYRRKRPFRPRRRRITRLRRTRLFKNNVHFFKRHTTVTNMTLFPVTASVGSLTKNNGFMIPTTTAASATPAYYAFGIGFCLADIPSYTEFTNLYDFYKINGVALKFTPIFTDVPQSATAAASNTGCIMHMIYDLDDYTAPGTTEAAVDTLREYPGFKTYNLASNRTLKKYIRPRPNLGLYSAGAFTGRAMVKPMWIDCNDVNVAHYGLKGIIELYQLNANISYFPIKVEATYYISMKGVR